MDAPVLDNLEEWGRVLEELDHLRRDRTLDRHQNEILRLLRYRDNWRLREAALEALRDVQKPFEPVVEETCRIMMNEELYYQVRVLAAEALAAMGERLATSREPHSAELRRQIGQRMQELLDSHQPPILHQAVRRVLPTMR